MAVSMRKSLYSIRRGLASLRREHEISSQFRRCLFQTSRSLFSLGTADRNLRLLGNAILRSNNQQNLDFSSLANSISAASLRNTSGEINGKRNRLGVEIISTEDIKPAAPTPHHLKMYELSILDQLYVHFYMPFVYFYLNNDENGSQLNIINERRQLLKQSLSETLAAGFYPLAGKFLDDRFIDCNDDGVYYVEAKVSDGSLHEFLNKPDHSKCVNELLPFSPSSVELRSKTYVIMAQTTTFKCGGMAIGLYTSHKIMDGSSHATFVKAWASTARCLEHDTTTLPVNFFNSPSIFLPNPTQNSNAMSDIFAIYSQVRKTVTRRFVFDASSLMDLKQKTEASSRVMAVTSLIWKCAMNASRMTKSDNNIGCENDDVAKSSVLVLAVNLRSRSLPPLPPCSIGNIIWPACAPHDDKASDQVVSIARLLKSAVDKIDSDFVEMMKGKDGSCKVNEYFNELTTLLSDKKTELFTVTSLGNFGMYEADFGWGKPIWVTIGDADADIPTLNNVVYLMESSSGDGGIEAWVYLEEQEMAIFERDADILAYASINPSPLR